MVLAGNFLPLVHVDFREKSVSCKRAVDFGGVNTVYDASLERCRINRAAADDKRSPLG